jgi:hypothetical protein
VSRIQTTGDVYIQTIEASVLNAMNSRTTEILSDWKPAMVCGKNVKPTDGAVPRRRVLKVAKQLDELGPNAVFRRSCKCLNRWWTR